MNYRKHEEKIYFFFVFSMGFYGQREVFFKIKNTSLCPKTPNGAIFMQ